MAKKRTMPKKVVKNSTSKKVTKKTSKKNEKKNENENNDVEESEDQVSYTDADLHEDAKKEIFKDGALVKVRFKEQESKISKNGQGNLMLAVKVDVLDPDDESKVIRVNDVRDVRAWVGLTLTNKALGAPKNTPKKWPKQQGQGHHFIASAFKNIPEVQPPSWDSDDGTLHYCDDVYDQEQLDDDPNLYNRLCNQAKRASGELQAKLYNNKESLIGKVMVAKISSKDPTFVTAGNFKAELWEEEEFTPLDELVVFKGGLEGYEEADDEDDDLFDDDDE